MGVEDGVEALLVSGSVVVHNLKPQREAVLGCFAWEVEDAFVAFRAGSPMDRGTPTLCSEMNVRSARTQSSDASCAS